MRINKFNTIIINKNKQMINYYPQVALHIRVSSSQYMEIDKQIELN